jgi:diacylglycerol kinase
MPLTSPPAADVAVPEAPEAQSRSRRPWRDKFRVALRGLKFGIRGHSSFAVHFFFAAAALSAAVALQINAVEWCLVILCIGLVLTAELFNSCVETLFRCLDEKTRDRAWPCLDIAAGAVLLASVTAAVVGLVLFLPKLADLLHRL